MITRLQVKNYLSLRDVDLQLNPRNNIFVGPNMAGKSSLIDCFRFLTQMVTNGLQQALLDRGGFLEVVWNGGHQNRIRLHLTAENNDTNDIYGYDITILGSATGVIAVEKEHLVVASNNQSTTLIDLNNGQGTISHRDGSPAFTSPGPGHSALEFNVPGWIGTDVRALMASWRFYRPLPILMKQPNAATNQTFLTENGDNFSSWLLTLRTNYPEEFRMIEQAATDIFPDLEALLTPLTQFVTSAASREKNLLHPIPVRRMSDGEVTFLAWLSLIFAPVDLGSPFLCAEEPENHLHPRLLETLAELLHQRQNEFGAQASQIIMTTHSPYLIDRFNLEDLIIVEKRDGATRYTKPASKEHLRALIEREELGLGDLWFAGALSGDIC
jgi:predicted ATPase